MKHLKITALLIAGVILLSGCSTALSNADDLMKTVDAAERPDNPSQPKADYVATVADFSLQLLQTANTQDESVLLSPASVYLALSMTLNGASGETFDRMRQALASDSLDEASINEGSRNWLTLLAQTGEKTELFLSNALWIRKEYSINQDFLKRNADYYGASAYALDFSLPSSVETMNDWVRQATRDRIDKIIDDIDSDVMMYLMNAITFKADWQTPFDPELNRESPFKTSAGDLGVLFMHRTGDIAFIREADVTGVWLPYEDNEFAFFALLPDESIDLDHWIGALNHLRLSNLLDSRETASVALSLPKFEIAYEDSLKNELAELGMAQAFTDSADFSRMHASGISDLFINEIKHKTYCRVDEKGTEAAAVTSVEMRQTSLPNSEIELTFDRPFLYGIIDVQTGIPLFLGTMKRPEFSD